jgi:hypothetical protein
MRTLYYFLVTGLFLLWSPVISGQAISLFSTANAPQNISGRQVRQLVIDEAAVKKIDHTGAGTSFYVSVPALSGANETMLELQPYAVFTDAFKVVTSESKGAPVPYQQKHFYVGKIAGNKNSIVMLSIDATENCFLYMSDSRQVWIIRTSTANNYTLYKEDGTAGALFKEDDILRTAIKKAVPPITTGRDDLLPTNKCVGIYTECVDGFYNHFGSVQGVADCVSDLFAIVSLLYANQGIPIKISELFVWTTPDPYVGIQESLGPFANNRPNINGNIGILLFDASAGGIGMLGPPNCNYKIYSTAGVGFTANPYPNYTSGIMVYAHELGHNFGSPHTHDCAWPGGRIDNCVATPGCTAPDPNYPGTIMSYCGIFNFTNGFGRLPGNLIRDSYKNIPSSCLFNCGLIPIPEGCAPVPQNVTVELAGDTSLTVSWDANGTDSFAVDYQKPGDQFPVTVFTTATSVTITGLAYCTTYRIRVQGMCGLNAGYFSPYEIITTGPPPPLCKSFGESTADGWIESVQVNNIVQQTGDNGGRLLSCAHFNVAYGGLTYLELTPGPLPLQTPVYWRVWIDVNQDGVFDDSESIYTSAAATGKVYANVFVPAVPLITFGKLAKIKIAMKAGDVPLSCEVFPSGEVEEYLVDFNYTDPHCYSRGESDANEWIARVQLANLDNSSGPGGGYTNFTASTPLDSLKKDTTYTIQVTSGRAFAQGRRLWYRAWLDFNRNEIFEASEMVLDRYSLQLSTVSQSFTVPASTTPNKKFAMRVAVKYMSPPEACEIFPEGEVEDYGAVVVDTSIHHKQVYTKESTPLDKTISLYPVPARDEIIVDIASEKDQHIQLQVLNNKGVVLKTIAHIELLKGRRRLPVNIMHYRPGIYFIKVISVSGDVAIKKFVVI